MTRNSKGFNFSFLLILGIMLCAMYINSFNNTEESYTQGALIRDLEAGKVSSVIIEPNRETPTGSAKVTLTGGMIKTIYVTDVNDLQYRLELYQLDPLVKDIPKESWLSAYGLPILLGLGVVMFVLYLLNGQGSGGGTNAKMMNFGKSRAKMSHGDGKIKLDSVAGLKEEKEELEEIKYSCGNIGSRNCRLFKRSFQVYQGRSQNSKGSFTGGTSGNRENPISQGGGRRSQCSVL